MAVLLAGLPVEVTGSHGQPAVRFGHGRGRNCGPGDQDRRGRPHDCRRRREHVARAVRDGQGGQRVRRATRRSYDTTIGWRFVNPLMKKPTASTRCPRPPTTWPRISRCRAPIRTRSRCAASSAGQTAQAAGLFSAEEMCRSRSRRAGETVTVSIDEHPRPKPTLEDLAKLKPVVTARMDGDGGQRFGCQRRRCGPASWRRKPPRRSTG